MSPDHTTEAATDLFSTEIAGYSILQLTVAAFAVAGVVAATRWSFGKAFGKNHSQSMLRSHSREGSDSHLSLAT